LRSGLQIAALGALAAVAALAGWLALRLVHRRRGPALASSGGGSPAAAAPCGRPAPRIEVARVRAASEAAAQRLWRLAFGAPAGAPSDAPPLERGHARVRELICAVLAVDELDANYFPRRPALMPQLLQAVDDPSAASDKLSRMIAHDPVLSADVLRLANSSLYRVSAAPIETIKGAIVVCGVDALKGILATAMLRPVFRASRTNFPRLPRMLWERTERAARAAELYSSKAHPQDRFESQLVVLLSALGPLVVYSAALDGYSRAPRLSPNPALFVELIQSLAVQMSQRIARDWQTSPRLAAALQSSSDDSLAAALHLGELLGTLSLLESQTVMSRDESLDIAKDAGLPEDWVQGIWTRLTPA
jgi:HD-like signal output (HDOD) protein